MDLFDQLLQQGFQQGLQYAQGAVQQSQASAEQRRQIGEQFDLLAGKVTGLFNQIQSLPVISQADYEQAAGAYQQLAQVVQQYGGAVPYIAEQWGMASYQRAYESRLQQIRNAVSQSSVQSFGTSSETGGGLGVGQVDVLSSLPSYAVWIVVGLVAWKALK